MPRPAEDFLKALAEFIRHDHFLIHLENLYPTVKNREAFTKNIRSLYAEAARTGTLEYGYIWMANSEFCQGTGNSGAALLIAGVEGTPASAENAARVVRCLESGEYRNLPPAKVAEIESMLGDETFQIFRRRQLPSELTGDHPVYLFDTMLTRDALFDEQGGRVAQIPCLVNTRGEGSILALPPAVMHWVTGRPQDSLALERSHHGSVKPSVPARPGTGGDSLVRFDGKPIEGALDMTGSQLPSAIAVGVRFVRFRKAFSFFIFTSIATTPAICLPAGNTGAGPAWRYSLFTMLFGWWGIPWGPIRSIQALLTNAKGGIDVTNEVLLQNLGPDGARRAQAFRPTTKQETGGGLWALRFALLTPLLLFVLLAIAIGREISENREKLKAMPGYAEFSKAESDLRKGQSSLSPAGKEIARLIHDGFAQALDPSDSRILDALPNSSFQCHTMNSRLIVFVRFPGFRKWDEPTQKRAADTLWLVSQSVLATSPLAGKENPRIYLGIMGSAHWAGLAEGGITGEPTTFNPKPADEDLIPWFAEDPT